ncbi:hypothetical protein JAAARDRAFT_269020 [Jaapia argillacea MUCL 33604]|uniref:Uncharacterized protein n=1 Tax=Jaapia argillacea MUCL 33604 TaxID=933084 RepID=A0A067Q290_9AGAM|nr:hypothetical protein JAAARDRAFT_269020 [Jaapia argillacea MUCL 33604]
MSAFGMNEEGKEVLRPILMRSSTPAASEKVLMYLESMSREGFMSDPEMESVTDGQPGNTWGQWDPMSPKITGGSNYRVPSPRVPPNGGHSLEELARSQVSYGGVNGQAHDADVESNIQDRGGDSEVAHQHPTHEPGPDDEPGPRYISYGSGPSFGNLGPLRESSALGAGPWNGYQVRSPQHPRTTGMLTKPQSTPAKAAGVPLPGSALSPKTTSVGINIEPPSSSESKRAKSQARSVASKVPSRVSERDEVATVTGSPPPNEANMRPASRSQLSRAPSQKSGATQRSRVTDNVTQYPPLPNSSVLPTLDIPKTPKAPSRAPSISPSDSPSNYKPKPSKQPSARAMSPVRSNDGYEQSPRAQPRDVQSYQGGAARSHASGALSPTSGAGMSWAFSPHRHAPTQADLFHAAMGATGEPKSPRSPSKQASAIRSQLSGYPEQQAREGGVTPTPSRPQSPLDAMNDDDQRLVRDLLSKRASRTSMAASALETDIQQSHFHDMELCILLHVLEDPMQHEITKRAVRKAVRGRVKKLGMKYDNESIKQYRKSFHDHDPTVHLQPNYVPSFTQQQEPPDWAKELMQGMIIMQQRLEGLGPKIDSLKSSKGSYAEEPSYRHDHDQGYTQSELDRYGETPQTQTVKIQTQATGTVVESLFQAPGTDVVTQSVTGQSLQQHDGTIPEEEEFEEEDVDQALHIRDSEARPATMSELMMGGRDDSPGQQFLEEELYKLRIKRNATGSHSALSHKTWEVAREGPGADYDEDDHEGNVAITESGLPEIPEDGNTGVFTDTRKSSPPLPPIPQERSRDMVPSMGWQPDYGSEPPIPPWQRVHQRLLSWAIVWPMTELDSALNSTTRGHQVDEVALSIWSTQTYKRYVRSKMTDTPQGRVDRLFVPPNMADAISNAVYNGRHGDACAMLRDLWNPFGLEGMPRLLIVLAKHRSDANHWVVHRFSLPDGSLTTYDTYPERCLPDGRPLGWWFAIRIAWPNAIYPSPDHLMQKMVRLHRPLQLSIDNSVAASGIWRNLLMGSRAERSVDLERLRDLINTEVKNLRQRKEMGKLSISPPRPNWEDMS